MRLIVVVSLLFALLVQSEGSNVAIDFAQLNYNFLLVPLSGRSGGDSSPNGLATGGARSIFILHSCMYDAWAVYQTLPAYSHPNNGIPKVAGTPSDVEKSVAYAGWTALRYMWRDYATEVQQIDNLLLSYGFTIDNNTNTDNPAGRGNRACNNVITIRRSDGFNEQGDEPDTVPYGVPWADYTNYAPSNPPQGKFADCSTVKSFSAWSPITNGNTTQAFSSVHMFAVQPFALKSPVEFPMDGPNLPGTSTEPALYQELNQLLNFSANLNDRLKMIAEYWASSSGAALWEGITLQSARNSNQTLDNTIKLFFASGIAAYDAAISCWTYKRIYNNMRPVTTIQCLLNGNVTAWKGPYQGVGTIPVGQFQTYVGTPPFSEYPSGHSTWSGAAFVVLRNFFGDDVFRGDSVVIPAGGSGAEGRITVGSPGYIAGVTDVPNSGPATVGYVPATNITLSWTTFSGAQDEAGISRLYGGFHYRTADEDAKALGRYVGQKAWDVANMYFQGNPPMPTNYTTAPNNYTTVTGNVDNVVIKFNQLNYDLLLQPLGSSGNDSSPNGLATGGARSFFILNSCIYDTWAAYQATAVPSHASTINKRTGNATSISTSIAYAGYTAIAWFYRNNPTQLTTLRTLMTSLGYNPNITDNNPVNVIGLGRFACQNVINQRQNDGYNELGNDNKTKLPNLPWADDTNFNAVNYPQGQIGFTNCSALRSQINWTPLLLANGPQPFSSVQMVKVKPFSLDSPYQFPMEGPALPGTTRQTDFYNQMNEVISFSGQLNDTLKAIIDYWASSSGATLWMGIAIQSARNTQLSLDDTVKLLFAMGIGGYDAGIACWSYKRMYNNMRPLTSIPCFASQNINAWKGPYQGVGLIDRTLFKTYVGTPPFSEYPSGHSTWSGAASVILKNFFNDDTFRGDPVVFPAGATSIEPRITVGNAGYVAGVTDVPNSGPGTVGYTPANNVTLTWPTFTAAQDEAGISRIYGGFHFSAADVDAKALGRLVGQRAWNVAQTYWQGTAPSTTGGMTTGATSTNGGTSGAGSESEATSLAIPMFALISILVFLL